MINNTTMMQYTNTKRNGTEWSAIYNFVVSATGWRTQDSMSTYDSKNIADNSESLAPGCDPMLSVRQMDASHEMLSAYLDETRGASFMRFHFRNAAGHIAGCVSF